MRRWQLTIGVLALRVVGSALQIGVIFVVARGAGVAVLGAYIVFTSVTRLTGTALAFGRPMHTLRTISQLDARRAGPASRAALRDSAVAVLQTAAIAAAVTIVPIAILVSSGQLSLVITATTALCATATAILLLGSNALKARDRQPSALLLEFVAVPATVISWTAGSVLARNPPTATTLLVVHTIAAIVAAGAALLRWYSDDRKRTACLSPDDDIASEGPLPEDSWRSRAAFGLTNLANVGSQTTPQIVLPLVMTIGEVGQLGAAMRVSAAPGVLVTGLASVYAPRFARLWAVRDMPGLRRAMWETQAAVTGLYAPFAILFIATPGFAASLLGEDMSAVAPALRILAMAQVVNSLTGLSSSLLSMGGMEGYVFRSTAFSALQGLVASVVGGAWFGVTGAAAGYAVTVALRNILWYSRVHRILQNVSAPTINRRRDS